MRQARILTAGCIMSTSGNDDGRAWRIHLAQLREELLSPVNATLGYAELMRDEATRSERSDILRDANRILTAARVLASKVDKLVDVGQAAGSSAPAVATREHVLRHELRTPLNAIKGYGELVREELNDNVSGPLGAVLDRVLAAAGDVLQRLDRIVQLSVNAGPSSLDTPLGVVIAGDLLRSLDPARDERNVRVESGAILVVDDIEANRNLLSRRLASEGHRVACAEGGQQALRLLAEQQIDLVLLDLMMPDINGLDVLMRMKADERLRHIPVIMITALAETESAIRCIEAGAEDYLPKPFDTVLLRARINAGLNKKRWHDREQTYLRRIEDETVKSKRLLLSILPEQIVSRLQQGEHFIADRFDEVSVLFADLVGFTEHAARTTPAALVEYLNCLFADFDALARECSVEKIKTIGDAYLAVSGLPEPRPDHLVAITTMALQMIDRLDHVNAQFGWPLQIRIGIHCGPIVAGIVGTQRLIYDIWGDTVNVASRLEAQSLPNRIHLSGDAARQLAGAFSLEPRGSIDIKGKGQLDTFFISRT